MIKILDCTTRDGGHITNWNFSDEFVFELIKKFQNSIVNFYEIGYRNHLDTENKGVFYNCKPEIIEKFYKVKGSLKIGVMTDTKRFSIKDFPGRKKDCIDFVRIACHPENIKETLLIAEKLYNMDYDIFVQLMDISNVDTGGYIDLYSWKNKNIIKSLYFADSYGSLHPEDVEKYYNKLKTLGYKKLSFHAHNNIKTALENTLKAINLGAYSVDVTQNGMGRCGGNLDSNELLTVIKTKQNV